jgi:hypothetical protein
VSNQIVIFFFDYFLLVISNILVMVHISMGGF